MIIESIKVAGFGPLQRGFEGTFKRENCLVGYNGGGKTTLLRLMAGVCGTDDATQLIAGQSVDHFLLRIRSGRTTFVFETRERFHHDEIAHFKASLPERASFPLTEWEVNFPSRCVDSLEALDRFKRYVVNHSASERYSMCHYSPERRAVQLCSGDGYLRAFWLLMADTPRGVPLLLDNPGSHLDLMAKRVIIDLLTNNDRQLFYTTHCPEMMLHDAFDNLNKHQKVFEVSDKKSETKQKSS